MEKNNDLEYSSTEFSIILTREVLHSEFRNDFRLCFSGKKARAQNRHF